MQKLLYIGVAGMVGVLARYWLSGVVAERYGETFPTGTVVVNLAGCLAIGFLYPVWEERFLVDPVIRTAVLIGFLGGFTTFSSFGIQTFALLRDGELWLAGLNILISNLGGLVMVWIGYMLGRLV